MPHMHTLYNYRTAYSEYDEGNGVVIYAGTKIVEWTADTITLRSGGWETVTTKRKMNQAANQFCLPFDVSQRKHIWYVDTPNGEVLFEDGTTFDRHTAIEGVQHKG